MNGRCAKRVLLVGWEGADWNNIGPMLALGQMPVLLSLIEGGACGTLSSLQPLATAPTWTSLTTGVAAHRHQILTDMEPNGCGDVRPVGAPSRWSRAFWNVLSQHGLRCHVVGFPASHPAERIHGIAVSDRYPQTFGAAAQLWPADSECIHPETRYEELMSLRVHPQNLPAEALREFFPESSPTLRPDCFEALAAFLARCATTHNAATLVATCDGWDCLAVRYDFIGSVSHLASEQHASDNKCHVESDPYNHIVPAAYRLQDMMLGRLLELSGDDTTVLVVSNHGFVAHPKRPKTDFPAGEHRLDRHRSAGILVAHGPAVVPAAGRVVASILDVAPSILALLGLPVSKESEGRSLDQIFCKNIDVAENSSIDSGDGVWPRHGIIDPWLAQELLSLLGEVGCLKPDDDSLAAIEHVTRERLLHLGKSLAESRNYEAAYIAFQDLHAREAAIYPQVHMAECSLRLGRLDEADRLIGMLEKLAPSSIVAIALRARWLSDRGQHEDGLELLQQVVKDEPDLIEAISQCGQIAMRLKRWAAAKAYFQRVIDLDADNWTAQEALRRINLGIDSVSSI